VCERERDQLFCEDAGLRLVAVLGGFLDVCYHLLLFLLSGFGFRVSSFGFRVSVLGFRISGFGFRVSVFCFLFSVFGFRVSVFCFLFSVFGFGFGVSDFCFGVSGLGQCQPGCFLLMSTLVETGHFRIEGCLNLQHLPPVF